MNCFQRVTVRKLVFAAMAAWIVAAPTIAGAQPREEGRPRPQQQQQQQDVRRGGGFQGMLRDIAGARLDRAHAAQRSDRPPPNDKNKKRR